MYIGGQLIRQFDAFLHLFRAAAAAMHSPNLVPEADQFALNRVLAGLGGPPAPAEVEVDLQSPAALPALCLFLALHPEPCPVGVTDRGVLERLRQLSHILAHAMMPMAAGGAPLPAEAVVQTHTERSLALHPVVVYREDGEIAAVQRTGGQNPVSLAPAGGPFKVIVNPQGPVVLDRRGPLHPVVVRATWSENPPPTLRL